MEDFLETLVGAVDNADADVDGLAALGLDGNGDRGFNDGVVVAADDFDVGVLELFAGEDEVGRTQGSFHNAAGNAEDRAGAGVDFERAAFALLVHLERVDALATEEFGEITSRKAGVDVLIGRSVGRDHALFLGPVPALVHFRTSGFEDLGRARRDGDEEDLARVALPEELGTPGLGKGAAHLERGLGGGDVRDQVGMVRFHVLDPSRAAGREVRERMFGHFVHFFAAFAEEPVAGLLDEFRTFFKDRLVSRAVAVVDLEADGFEGVGKLFRGEFAGLAAEFFADGDADGGRRMGDAEAGLVGENLFDLVDKAHLFDGVERAGDQALAAVKAGVFDDVVLGTEAAFNGVDRAELGARVAADAVFLVDVDDAAEFSLSEITLVGGSVLPVGAGAGVERTNLDRIVGH